MRDEPSEQWHYTGNISLLFSIVKNGSQTDFLSVRFHCLWERKFSCHRFCLFDGIFGVFEDSLPDGWGRLLVDRLLLKHNINPIETESLDRLAIVGSLGMGALQYVPEFDLAEETQIGDFDDIARECSRLLATNQTDSLDELFRLGGSSGGAKPKILTEVNGQPWLIKFPSKEDDDAIGLPGVRVCALRQSLRDRNGRNQIVPVRNMQRLFRNKAIRSSP